MGNSSLKLLSGIVHTAHSFYACKEQINAKKALYTLIPQHYYKLNFLST